LVKRKLVGAQFRDLGADRLAVVLKKRGGQNLAELDISVLRIGGALRIAQRERWIQLIHPCLVCAHSILLNA
jgi:hypothetical protein